MDEGEAFYYLHNPNSGFRSITNPNPNFHSNVRFSSAFENQNPLTNFPHAINNAFVGSGEWPAISGKKKKGRPRKYGPTGGTGSGDVAPATEITPANKIHKGRPKGSGRKQQLASLGEWINNSAGHAFTPHVMSIHTGEDIAKKILLFAKQRPRVLCILSANGAVSEMALRQPSSSTSGETVMYEGHFEIICLSGSYLVSENEHGDRTGGLSISVCTPDGDFIGGAIEGSLIAANLVQVVLCSFVYGISKSFVYKTNSKNKAEIDTEKDTRITSA